jgi:hypothetical protein
MMTKLRLAAALAALCLAGSAAAQERRPTLGLGVAIDPFADTTFPGSTIQLYVPMQIAPNLRIEPSLGILTVDAPAGGTDSTDITLGIGLFVTRRVAPPVDLHLGGRLKLNFASVDDGVFDDSGTDLAIAAAIGGEYYLVSRFSLGLEGQLGLYQNSDVSADTSGFFTTGLGFLRVYF